MTAKSQLAILVISCLVLVFSVTGLFYYAGDWRDNPEAVKRVLVW